MPDTNRSKLEIIAEILRKLRMPTGKTNIMSHCNMNARVLESYEVKCPYPDRRDGGKSDVSENRGWPRVSRTVQQDGSAA